MSYLMAMFLRAWEKLQKAKETKQIELRYDCKMCKASVTREQRLNHAKLHNPYIKKKYWNMFIKRRID